MSPILSLPKPVCVCVCVCVCLDVSTCRELQLGPTNTHTCTSSGRAHKHLTDACWELHYPSNKGHKTIIGAWAHPIQANRPDDGNSFGAMRKLC